jgi:sugar/nucleoside kinase (ribokinase family)
VLDVAAIGELLIDFTPAGLSGQGRHLFEQNPGGAPANVLACLSRLGHRTALISKVGDDPFGHFLRDELAKAGVSTRGLVVSGACHTTLAFVHLDAQGDRSFSFYRNPGADVLLQTSELSYNLIDDCQIFHFGSVSLTADPAREATLAAVRYAAGQGKFISYDPNLRLPLWPGPEPARSQILQAMPLADLVKVSSEELLFLTGDSDMSQGAACLLERYELQMVLVTLGPRGAYARNGRCEAWSPAYDVRTVDTTGAGDAFTGAFLHQLLQSGRRASELGEDDLAAFLAYANAAGSLTTRSKGAIPALPTQEEIEDCLAHVPTLG